MTGNVTRLPSAFDRTDLTPQEALASTQAYNWTQVITAGFVAEHNELVVRTSAMTRAEALWIVEHLKKHVLGDLD